jgi:hypothetical protein
MGGAGNGGGKLGRRPWKVAGVGASVPGDLRRYSMGKLRAIEEEGMGIKNPLINFGNPGLNRMDFGEDWH